MKDMATGEIYAAKADFEPRFLTIEHNNMSKLTDFPQVPNVHGSILPINDDNKDRFLMKMDLLGQDLAHIFDKSKKADEVFNLKNSCSLGQQMIRIIKEVHS